MFNKNNYLEKFRTDKWSNLTFEERLTALQDLENTLAKKQGRHPRRVEADCFKSSVAGYYINTDSSHIHINPNYLNSTDNSFNVNQ